LADFLEKFGDRKELVTQSTLKELNESEPGIPGIVRFKKSHDVNSNGCFFYSSFVRSGEEFWTADEKEFYENKVPQKVIFKKKK
jgi:hypothetical protein